MVVNKSPGPGGGGLNSRFGPAPQPMNNQELIVNKLLDFDIPKINADSLPKTQLTPVFNDAVGFSKREYAEMLARRDSG